MFTSPRRYPAAAVDGGSHLVSYPPL